MKRGRLIRRLFRVLVIIFLLMNASAFMHAWRFTHFSRGYEQEATTEKMNFGGKLKALFLGIRNPRPVLTGKPSFPYETILLQSNKQIECWYISADSSQPAKGTVALFHGYRGNKASMLDKAGIFRNLGYNTMLVDFMGSGGSAGDQTTIGYKEAEEVKTVYDYLTGKGELNIVLFGTSMGAVSILRAIDVYHVKPKGIIIECPFGTLYQTTAARFKMMGVPAFPMAHLLVFWGGVQNGFSGFSHKPVNYAKKVTCHSLLLYGEQDEKVSRKEIDAIFHNMNGAKTIRVYPDAGHENYLSRYKTAWTNDVTAFLDALK